MTSLETTNDAGYCAQAADGAAVCMEAAMIALVALMKRIELPVGTGFAEGMRSLEMLNGIWESVCECAYEAADEYERLTGVVHPFRAQ